MTELTSRKPSQHLLGVNELKTMYSADSNFSSMGSDSSVLTKTPIIITSPVQVRATFMPKLPKKLMQRRAAFNETHLICGHYVNQDFFHVNIKIQDNIVKMKDHNLSYFLFEVTKHKPELEDEFDKKPDSSSG
jgi:hypothetical protein